MSPLNLWVRRIVRLLRSGTTRSRPYAEYLNFLRTADFSYPAPLFNLTVDLELGWSRSRRGDGSMRREESLRRSAAARDSFPEFLSLLDRYSIPTTFALVAHLALPDCRQHRPPPSFKPYWLTDPWYAVDPNTGPDRDPDYYGPALAERIVKSETGHELASHSFSHVDLGDDATPPEVAEFEIFESQRILKELDGSLTTFVFPNNRPAFLSLLEKSGFTIYRQHANAKIEKDASGCWRFPVGLWLSPQAFSPKEAIELVDTAIQRKQLVNLWCHLHEFSGARQVRSFFEPVLADLRRRADQGLIRIDTIRGIVSGLGVGSGEAQRRHG